MHTTYSMRGNPTDLIAKALAYRMYVDGTLVRQLDHPSVLGKLLAMVIENISAAMGYVPEQAEKARQQKAPQQFYGRIPLEQ